MDVQDSTPPERPKRYKDPSLDPDYWPHRLVVFTSGELGRTRKAADAVIDRLVLLVWRELNELDARAFANKLKQDVRDRQEEDPHSLTLPLEYLRYINSAVIRGAINEHAAQERAPDELTHALAATLANTAQLNAAEKLEQEELASILHKELWRCLDDDERAVLTAKFVHDATLRQIADLLRIHHSTVADRIEQALKKLRGPVLSYIRGEV